MVKRASGHGGQLVDEAHQRAVLYCVAPRKLDAHCGVNARATAPFRVILM